MGWGFGFWDWEKTKAEVYEKKHGMKNDVSKRNREFHSQNKLRKDSCHAFYKTERLCFEFWNCQRQTQLQLYLPIIT